MIQLIAAALGVAGQSLGSWIEGKNAERQAKLEIKKIEAQGRVEQAKALAQIEAEYDNYAQVAMKTSWKDEFLTIVITAPFLVSFATPYIELFTETDLTTTLDKAWAAVSTAPDWYQWSFLGIIIATFGLRWMAKNIAVKGTSNVKSG